MIGANFYLKYENNIIIMFYLILTFKLLDIKRQIVAHCKHLYERLTRYY